MSVRLLLLASVTLAATGSSFAQDSRSAVGGLLVSPLLHRLAVKAGQKSEISFTVENPGQERLTLDGVLSSFTMEAWTYQTLFGTSHPRDCTNWLAQSNVQIPFGPGARKDVRLPLEVPKSADGVYWTMLRLTPRPEGSVTKSYIQYEVPVVIVVGKNPKPTLTVRTPILASTASRDLKRTFTAALPIENPSEGFTTIGTTGELRNADSGRIVTRFTLEDRNLMPGTKRHTTFLVPELADGRYRLSFRAEMGTKALPPVTADYVVQKGIAKPQGEPGKLELTPVTVIPSSLMAQVPAGGSRSISLRVTNNSARPLKLDLEPRAVTQSANGAIGLGSPSLPSSMKIEIDSDPEPLGPGETRIVKLRASLGDGAEGDQWFGLAVSEHGNGAALAESLMGTLSVPGKSKADVAIESPKLITDGTTPVAIRFSVRNTGNVAIRPEPGAAVLAEGVRLVERPAVPTVGDGGLLPGASVENSLMIPQTLAPGNYVVEISYQFGEKDYARCRVPIKIVASKVARTAKAKP